MNNTISKQIILPLLFFIFLISFSVLGFVIIEKWSLFDSLFMTVITLSTVGYGETHPLSNAGRVHAMIVILTCVGFYSSMLVYFSRMFFEGKIKEVLKIRTMENKIKNLNEHYIICGYGRIGREVCENVKTRENIKFIVIECSFDNVQEAENDGFIVLKGDATDDHTLLEAGIKKAKGIICALPDDAHNVFIALSAKVLNPDIYIIARADKSESMEKLRRAGAHLTVAPYITGGRKIANAIKHPDVIDFLDTVLHDDDVDLQFGQVYVNDKSKLIGIPFHSHEIREETGSVIVAVKRPNGNLITSSKSNHKIEEKDILIALGTKEQIKHLKKI